MARFNLSKRQVILYAKRYDDQYREKEGAVEEDMKRSLTLKDYLNKSDFLKICLWKSKRPKKRYESNSDKYIKAITGFSFSTKSEEARIRSLQILNGVSFPVASVILHFAFPKKYPILDFRVIWSLGWQRPSTYNFQFWEKYCKKIRKIAKKHKLSLREVDKALWEYSKENQPRGIPHNIRCKK